MRGMANTIEEEQNQKTLKKLSKNQFGRDGKHNRGGAKSENSQKAFKKPI